jgi:hypothetical protein
VASCVSGELCQYRNVVVLNCYVASSDVASSVVASCVVANCVVASCYVANCMGIKKYYRFHVEFSIIIGSAERFYQAPKRLTASAFHNNLYKFEKSAPFLYKIKIFTSV